MITYLEYFVFFVNFIFIFYIKIYLSKEREEDKIVRNVILICYIVILLYSEGFYFF